MFSTDSLFLGGGTYVCFIFDRFLLLHDFLCELYNGINSSVLFVIEVFVDFYTVFTTDKFNNKRYISSSAMAFLTRRSLLTPSYLYPILSEVGPFVFTECLRHDEISDVI